ncbi:MAG: hypothetical protein HeimC2_04830 [Candidatus Heimdallarchaeota archaeon LC_2]|nr:MAG: hypothetical protein HeimC2_04830 [Candidatus Heimdallarchaeota archaeon LC_2]
MKQSIKIILIFELLLIPFLIVTADSVTAVEGGHYTPIKETDNQYYFRIETSQWEIKAFDLVRVRQEYGNDPSLNQIHEFEEKHRLGSFERGSTINFEVYSRDVQHGFSINEVGLAVATIRPKVGEVFGLPTLAQIQWPDEDVTISAFCHIFCGLGHPDMKMKFVIGEGSEEYGPPLFYAIIAINVAILLFVANKIWNKID